MRDDLDILQPSLPLQICQLDLFGQANQFVVCFLLKYIK